MRKVLRWYRRNARVRGIPWELTSDQFSEIAQRKCFYTGAVPSKKFESNSGEIFQYNGIDRVDNTKGYTVENCVACAPAINQMKADLPLDVFLSLCRMVAANFPESRVA